MRDYPHALTAGSQGPVGKPVHLHGLEIRASVLETLRCAVYKLFQIMTVATDDDCLMLV